MNKSAQRVEKTKDGLTVIYSHDDIPQFKSEAEEHEFWKSHTWSDALMEQAEADPDLPLPRPRARGSITSIRFDSDTRKRLKALAKKKGMGYQALLKTFVAERLYEEEKREGMI